ncbi:MAG: helix-turn-helix domain-containing protein [Thermomicrobiales bacterium]|nr:helix-turn-helix domain-containing protein [Thermomicrobiales bacterium]
MAEITVGDLLAWDPRLMVAAGSEPAAARDVLEREIAWSVAARAAPPMLPPLRGGELVLLSHRILDDLPEPLDSVLAELERLGVAAVALAAPPGQGLPGPAPVLRFIADAPTSELEGELNRLLTVRRGELYRTGNDLGRLLAAMTSASAASEAIVAKAAALTGLPIRLARAGEPTEPAPGDVMAAAPAGLGLTIVVGPATAAASALSRMVAERVAEAVVEAARRTEEQRPRGAARVAALNFHLFDEHRFDRSSVLGLGLPAAGCFRVLLGDSGFDAARLSRLARTVGVVHEAGMTQGWPAAVADVRSDLTLATLQERLETALRAEGRTGAWLAVSGSVPSVEALREAAQQARFVARLLARGAIRGPVAAFDAVQRMGVYQLLYRITPDTALREFAATALGDLPAGDRHGELSRTLLAFLEAGGSGVDAAHRLGIHRNTLSYRLRRIAQLTGQDPADPQRRLALHLALLARDLVEPPEQSE